MFRAFDLKYFKYLRLAISKSRDQTFEIIEAITVDRATPLKSIGDCSWSIYHCFFLARARDKCGEDEIASVRESPDRTFPDRDGFAVANWPPFDVRNANPFNRWLRSCEFREKIVITRCRTGKTIRTIVAICASAQF